MSAIPAGTSTASSEARSNMDTRPSTLDASAASGSSQPRLDPLRYMTKEQMKEIDAPINAEHQRRKRKWTDSGHSPEEIRGLEKSVTSYEMALLQDQQSTLFPPPPTAFTSYPDVINRLLPYHVWQIHDTDLYGQEGSKREEFRVEREKNEARACVALIDKIKDRYTRIKRREGMFPSDLPSMITMINNSTHEVRRVVDSLQYLQRTARNEFETLEAVRRARERLTSASFPKPPATPTIPSNPTKPGSSSLTSIQTQPSTTSIATQSSPARAGTSTNHTNPERGRGRGRARGRGRGAAPTTSSTHVSTPVKNPPSPKSVLSGKDEPTVPSEIKAEHAFKVNVPTSSLPQLIEAGVIADPKAKPSDPPADHPARVAEVVGEATGLKVTVKKCTQKQLHVLARILNIKLDVIKDSASVPASAVPTTATPTKSAPAPAEPPRSDPNKRTRSSTTSSAT